MNQVLGTHNAITYHVYFNVHTATKRQMRDYLCPVPKEILLIKRLHLVFWSNENQ
jgi:hypothetical protein